MNSEKIEEIKEEYRILTEQYSLEKEKLKSKMAECFTLSIGDRVETDYMEKTKGVVIRRFVDTYLSLCVDVAKIKKDGTPSKNIHWCHSEKNWTKIEGARP